MPFTPASPPDRRSLLWRWLRPIAAGLLLIPPGAALPDTPPPVALHCALDASVPAEAGAAICADAARALAARFPGQSFAGWDGHGTPARFIALEIGNWRPTGVNLRLRWRTTESGTVAETQRSLSISDKALSVPQSTAFVLRILNDTDFPF